MRKLFITLILIIIAISSFASSSSHSSYSSGRSSYSSSRSSYSYSSGRSSTNYAYRSRSYTTSNRSSYSPSRSSWSLGSTPKTVTTNTPSVFYAKPYVAPSYSTTYVTNSGSNNFTNALLVANLLKPNHAVINNYDDSYSSDYPMHNTVQQTRYVNFTESRPMVNGQPDSNILLNIFEVFCTLALGCGVFFGLRKVLK